MKFSFSLESVNLLTSGPNFIYKQSKSFWVSYFKYIAAAGFNAVELPFNPFSSDPMAFETGRCGIPLSAQAICAKYGSPAEFLCFLRNVGIDAVSSVHASANDAMLELVASKREPGAYYDLFADMLRQALAHCESLRCETLVVSPSPEIGWLKAVLADDMPEAFAARTAAILADVKRAADKAGVVLALRAEYWSLFRGDAVVTLAEKLNCKLCTDPAHMHIAGQDVISAVSAVGSRLVCPRLTDTGFTDTHRNYERINAEIPVEGPQKIFCDLGDGGIDLLAYAQAIQNAGYTGYVVCEQRKTLDVYRALLKLRWYLDHEISGKLR